MLQTLSKLIKSCPTPLGSVGNYISTALAIRASDSQNALAWCKVHSPRKMPPLTPKNLCNDSQASVFSGSHNHGHPAWHNFHVEISCSGSFMWHLLRIADRFYCFILVFIINFWQTLEIFPHFCSFNWKTAKQTSLETRHSGVNNLSIFFCFIPIALMVCNPSIAWWVEHVCTNKSSWHVHYRCLIAELRQPKGPPSGAPYSCGKEKEAHYHG